MNSPVRHVWKGVSVPVEITNADLVKLLSVTELEAECRRRGIALKKDYAGRKFKVPVDAMTDVVHLFMRKDIAGAMLALERLLPPQMRNLESDLRRFYGRAA